jgi:hypothetical protein
VLGWDRLAWYIMGFDQPCNLFIFNGKADGLIVYSIYKNHKYRGKTIFEDRHFRKISTTLNFSTIREKDACALP